ncbi:hypothetical protein CICLE_v10005318mg [Citrus x clementina]|uniref:HMA domain-containing protein n=1 Tax=Citrus clementina TaxID=85681 RepID=V4RFS8_CITCL|nr:vegetative cell wall protein gp1 [Citrus x clementina]ESR32713.1 hypothetical protein CICLE_v10005318mg [Citrus x clementina]
MAPELEKPRVTEIQVRMDCNGCVQKIKKALHGINGIYDLHIDFPQQKLTIVGWADPERIVKAIRKTRKIATISSHSEQTEPSNQPTEQALPEDGAPAPSNDAPANPPPPEGPPAEQPQPAEPPKDPPPTENPAPPENPPPPEDPQPEVKPSPIAADANANQQACPSRAKDIGEVHVIHHHPPDYGYRYSYGYGNNYSGHWNRYPSAARNQHEAPQGPQPVYNQHEAPQGPQPVYNQYGEPQGPKPVYNQHGEPQGPQPVYNQHGAPQGPQPVYVTHSYNTYKPSPYVTEYEYLRSPPRHTHYSRMDHYSDDYHNNYHNNNVYYNTSNGSGNGNITSIFSDENPNACTVM